MKSVYIGNLPYTSTPDDLRALFSPFGIVEEITIILDHQTKRPRGFAFVLMDDAGALAAVQALNAQEYGGRRISVSEARERKPRPSASLPPAATEASTTAAPESREDG